MGVKGEREKENGDRGKGSRELVRERRAGPSRGGQDKNKGQGQGKVEGRSSGEARGSSRTLRGRISSPPLPHLQFPHPDISAPTPCD